MQILVFFPNFFNSLQFKFKDIGIFVDPENVESIRAGLLKLSEPVFYQTAKRRVENFNFTHNWSEIAQEFIALTRLAWNY